MSSEHDEPNRQAGPEKRRFGHTVRKCVLVSVGMFGFGFALVPAYQVFCEVTGFQGFITETGESAAARASIGEVDTSRTVTVEFVANVNADGGVWDFAPRERRLEVHPGELVTTEYTATNSASNERAWQANYNVAPGTSAGYFGKPDCFCFERQEFLGGESRGLPVTFFVDPDIPEHVDRLTLSYTLFELDG